MGEVRNFDLAGDLRLGFLGRVQHMRFVLDERPLERLLRAVHVEAFAVLAGCVIQTTPDVGDEVRILDLDVAVSTANLLPDFF